MQQHSITLDDVALNVQDTGGGPPVVLIHPWPMTLAACKPQVRALLALLLDFMSGRLTAFSRHGGIATNQSALKSVIVLVALIALGNFKAEAETSPRPYEGAWELASCTPHGADIKCTGQRLGLVIAQSESPIYRTLCGTFVTSNESAPGIVHQGTFHGSIQDSPKYDSQGLMVLTMEPSNDIYRAYVAIKGGDLYFNEDGYSGNDVKWPIKKSVLLRRVPGTEATEKKLVELRAVCKKWESDTAKYAPKVY